MIMVYVRLLLWLKEFGFWLFKLQIKASNFLYNRSSYYSLYRFRRILRVDVKLYIFYTTMGKTAWDIINRLPCQACGSTGKQHRVRDIRTGKFFCTKCMVFSNGFGECPRKVG